MNSYLPLMERPDGIGKKTQSVFGGYNHTAGACDGEIYDMKNLTGDFYPVLAPRAPRYLLRTLEKPNGLFARDGRLFWVDGESLYYDGNLIGEVEDSVKTFVGMGAFVVIMPDKKYYNVKTGEFGDMEASWSGGAKFQDGTIFGESAKGCDIVSTGSPFPFRAGDAVKITRAAGGAKPTTLVIREVSDDAMTLTFYENSFEASDAVFETSLAREIPDMEFITQNANRLWGCAGDAIYASKLGDIFNFNVFDGLSTDSWALETGSAGDFTGCISYLGYPIFFKEHNVYKIYGDKPSNFQAIGAASAGVDKGSGKSLAVAGDSLFYMARGGAVSYTGAMPKNVSAAFGEDRYTLGVSGSDGIKYYISAKGKDGEYSLFVFNTELGTWHKEDSARAVSFAYDKTLYMLEAGGGLYALSEAADPESYVERETVESMCEFGAFVAGNPNHKGSAKVQLRCEIEGGATLSVYIKFEGDADYKLVRTLSANTKKSFYLPIIPRRGDYFNIKLVGRGPWKLYSLTREFYIGSELK